MSSSPRARGIFHILVAFGLIFVTIAGTPANGLNGRSAIPSNSNSQTPNPLAAGPPNQVEAVLKVGSDALPSAVSGLLPLVKSVFPSSPLDLVSGLLPGGAKKNQVRGNCLHFQELFYFAVF